MCGKLWLFDLWCVVRVLVCVVVCRVVVVGRFVFWFGVVMLCVFVVWGVLFCFLFVL